MSDAPGHAIASGPGRALALLDASPGALPIAGGTAAQLAWDDGRPSRPLVDLGPLVDAARARPVLEVGPPADGAPECLALSAFAPLESIRRAPRVRDALPALAALIGAIGSAPVRRLGTLGGNLCWAPGDLGCAMLALGATYRFARAGSRPAAPAAELPAGELLLEVLVPIGAADVVLEKVGFRAAFSPSLVTVAIVRDASGVRVAAGGGPTAAQRLPAVEALVRDGRGGDGAAVRAAVAAGLRTADDALAGAAERADVAGRVIAGHLAALAGARPPR